MNFLSELMYFYWKICYFGHFLYTAPLPGGPRLYQGGRPPPPWPHAGYGPVCTVKEQCRNAQAPAREKCNDLSSGGDRRRRPDNRRSRGPS